MLQFFKNNYCNKTIQKVEMVSFSYSSFNLENTWKIKNATQQIVDICLLQFSLRKIILSLYFRQILIYTI